MGARAGHGPGGLGAKLMEGDPKKGRFVADLQAGDLVDECFVLAEKSLARKRNGDPFLTVAFSDRSGALKGVVWDRVEQIQGAAPAGRVVHVTGSVSEYRGERQVVVKDMKPVDPESVDPSDFLAVSERDVDGMFERLVRITAGLQSEDLKALFAAFWADGEFVDKFKKAPAAKHMHHAYLGGLLEHSLSMATLAEKVARHYSGIDGDLLVTGAVLHDIGKIREFDCGLQIDYSDEGRLVSHIVIGVQMLDEKLRSLPAISPRRAHLLRHMIVSHHGSREFGSPEPPKTIEAVLLNYIDEIDSKVNGIRQFMAGEDPAAAWTSYHRLLGRHFYTGRAPDEEGISD
jgi:3'-5' exoribonuclease